MKIVIGIDNGATGSIGVLGLPEPRFIQTPTVTEQNYTVSKQTIQRIDHKVLRIFFQDLKHLSKDVVALLESPMINARKFRSSASALRSFEATILLLEQLDIPWSVKTSKHWQKVMIPEAEGRYQLKAQSKKLGLSLYPQFEDIIKEQGDADGILIAKYAIDLEREKDENNKGKKDI